MNDWIEFINEKYNEFFSLVELEDKNSSHNEMKKIIGKVCSNFPKMNDFKNLGWFVEALNDDKQKWFVAEIFKKRLNVPRLLLEPFIKAAVNETNPSKNRFFIEPCIKSFGDLEVARLLKKYSVEGNKKERGGAEEAFYWVGKF